MTNQKITRIMNYIRLGDYPKNTENPFADELIDEMKVSQKRKYLKSDSGQKASMLVIQPESGEVAGEAQFYNYQEVDETQFTKIFASFFAVQAGLSRTGREVLIYIMTLLQPKSDKVYIRNDHALFSLGYKTRKSLLIGLGNLLERGVIARTQFEDEYYINPMVMFNGDRIAYVHGYVKKKEKASKSSIDDKQMSLFDFKTKPSFDSLRRLNNDLKPENIEAKKLAKEEVKNTIKNFEDLAKEKKK